jgi:hypothetical protein
MIQRIQTIYLLLAMILMSTTLLYPLATIVAGTDEIALNALGLSGLPAEIGTVSSPIFYCLMALLVLPTLLPIVTIFLYKKRLVQIRLCVSEIVLLLGSIAFIGIYCYRLCDAIAAMPNYQDVERVFSLGWPSIMPILSIILVVLAIRGIAKDEALVRSLDRIR